MAVRQVSDGGPDGTKIGQSASDLVAFHNASPVVQGTFTATLSATPAGGVTQTSPFGFSSSAQLIALMTLTNAIQTILVNKGFMASS